MRILSIIAVIFLFGCSAAQTVQMARTQNILIRTPHVEGAKCTINDGLGRKWKVRKTPGNVSVQDGHPPLQVICRKKGYHTSISTIDEHKQELLTIDGKRITIGLYQKFPATKIPRLIPTAIKEASGFLLDPTGSVSTKFPNEITMWMEPKNWNSEKDMRKWAYEKQIWLSERYIASTEDKATDELRKQQRRDIKQAKKAKNKERVEKVKEIAKKAVDAKTYSNAMRGGTKWTTDTAEELTEGALDSAVIAYDGASKIKGNITYRASEIGKDAAEQISTEVIKGGADIRKNTEEMHERSSKYHEQLMKSSSDAWDNGKNSMMEKSKWLPSWLKHSTKSKVGGKNDKEKAKDDEKSSKLDNAVKARERTQGMEDIPPWEIERQLESEGF